jgi:hypothetical protein
LNVEFSNSDAILTLSGIPEWQVIVWNWKSGERIATVKLDTTLSLPQYICFSSVNWRNITIAFKHELKTYNFEQFDSTHVKINSSRIALPTMIEEKEDNILSESQVF